MRLLAQGKIIANENWKGRAVLKFDLMNSFEAIENDDAVSPDLVEVLEKELQIEDDPEVESVSVVTEGNFEKLNFLLSIFSRNWTSLC